MKVNLLLYFEPELKNQIKEIANEEMRSLNSLINKILYDFVKNYKNAKQPINLKKPNEKLVN